MTDVELEFEGPVFTWRGPAPHHFVAVPAAEAELIAETAAMVSYGWGMIPVTVRIGRTSWTTALWPKDGSYVVPLKADVRRRERIAEGDVITLALRIGA